MVAALREAGKRYRPFETVGVDADSLRGEHAAIGISFRFYAFPEDGSLRRIPKRIASDLGITEEVVPELARGRQRIAQVIFEIDDGRPSRIMDARGFFGTFDAEGRVEDDMRASFHARAWTPRRRLVGAGQGGSSVSCQRSSARSGSQQIGQMPKKIEHKLP